ncbi:hypothetical protein I5907_16900 [Panacibacter sp. DH6]|uniref:Uncharacterized protein n=1 Tax=Panacibacter microcysteis TaxID=2793269 RepID=A0A931GYY1_9BACT|nr:hypothetical protein [Panacibacter microcysteis]MBG9377922.1 hypothetical protein [Panacibacter microcysteis]
MEASQLSNIDAASFFAGMFTTVIIAALAVIILYFRFNAWKQKNAASSYLDNHQHYTANMQQ